MQKEGVVFIGADFHGQASEMNYRIAKIISRFFETDNVFLSFKINKPAHKTDQNTIILPKNKLVAFFLLKKEILNQTLKGKKIFFFFLSGKPLPKIMIFIFIRLLGGKVVNVLSSKPSIARKFANMNIFYSKSSTQKYFSDNSFYLTPINTLPKRKISNKKYCLFASVPLDTAHLKSRGILDLINLFGKKDCSQQLVILNRNQTVSKTLKKHIQTVAKPQNITLINKSLSNNTLASYYVASNIIIIPFKNGVFPQSPMSIIEALAYGKPTISTKNHLSKLIASTNAGFEIKNLEEIPHLIDKINKNYSKYSKNAKALCKKEFQMHEFENNLKTIQNFLFN